MPPVQVLLVDDHNMLRDALSGRLSQEPSIEIVGSVDSADAAKRFVQSKVPDIIVSDIDMPGLLAFDAIRQIHAFYPAIKIIFMSGHISDFYIESALSVGAVGYLSKDEPPEMLVKAILAVAGGGAYFSESVMARIVFDGSQAKLADAKATKLSTLTTRELEILQYLAKGLGRKEIAAIIHVSLKTVDKHAENLMRKLQIGDRVELARFAIREGLSKP